jgi:hypothetical protein
MKTAEEKKQLADEYNWSHAESMKHWRAWGSWFSWGSPVGLGLFFISLAFSAWILAQAFNW